MDIETMPVTNDGPSRFLLVCVGGISKYVSFPFEKRTPGEVIAALTGTVRLNVAERKTISSDNWNES